MKRAINQKLSAPLRLALASLPFLLVIVVYFVASEARLAINPDDKLLPSLGQMGSAIEQLAFQPSRRTGEYLFWTDTGASLYRLGLGVLFAAMIGLFVGLLSGSLPVVSATITPLVTAISLVPPLAILPILFIAFGLGEVSKIALITLGIAPFIARDMHRAAQAIPIEQLVKAQTLGANSVQVIVTVVLPQILPKLITAVRLSLGAGWLFLIAAEAVASSEGLGYRIFLVRRYLAMDVILPYVIWITLLAFVFDWLLATVGSRLFPWAQREHA